MQPPIQKTTNSLGNCLKHRFLLTRILFTELVLVILIFSIPSTLQSQTYHTFKGKVIEKQGNLPVPFAAIGIKKAGIGVNSNELGEFTFHFSSKNINDTIDISCLGYLKVRLPIKLINFHEYQTVELSANMVSLNDVTIKGKARPLKAKEIVAKAILHIPDNYSLVPFQLSGYYRDYLKENSKYYNLVEAAITIEDNGFNTYDFEKSLLQFQQFRINKDYTIDFDQIVPYEDIKLKTQKKEINKYIPSATMQIKSDNEFTILRIHDPIRNHQNFSFSFINTFDTDFVKNHIFKLQKVTYNDSVAVYIISFRAEEGYTDKNKQVIVHYSTGTIYINSRTYAIEKISYLLEVDSQEFNGKLYELNLEYKEFNKKMYLNYLSFSNYFEIVRKSKSTGIIDSRLMGKYQEPSYSKTNFYQYREFFVNKVSESPFQKIDFKNSFSKNKSLRLNSLPEDSAFWNGFNYTHKPLQ